MFKDLIGNVTRDIRGTIQNEIREKAKSLVPFSNGSAKGFMKGERSKNLPADAVPQLKTNTEAIIADGKNNNDWRVSLSVPPVIRDLDSPLLNPLSVTGNRMIFPFTPSVIFSHSASYSAMQPVHSNYPFYNYQNSSVDAITISGDFFTETNEDAEYWVAAVTFLRTATKMFYGDNGANSGNPPAIVKLNGYGEYVFKNVPCVITSFNIDMPQDVDYFKTTIQGDEPSNDAKAGTWVPSQSLIAVTVQPIYSRSHVEQFNLNQFVNGELISKRGFV